MLAVGRRPVVVRAAGRRGARAASLAGGWSSRPRSSSKFLTKQRKLALDYYNDGPYIGKLSVKLKQHLLDLFLI